MSTHGAVPGPPGAATILSATRRAGRWLVAARFAAGTVAVLALLLFVTYIPSRFTQLQATCTATTCDSQQLTPAMLRTLTGAGISVRFYAGVTVLLDVVLALAYVGIAALIAWRRPHDAMALFVALFLVLFGIAIASEPNVLLLETAHPAVRLLGRLVRFLYFVTLPLFFYLFPDGRFVPGWTRWLALLWIMWRVLLMLFPAGPFGVLMPVLWPTFLLSWIGAQVYRYLRVSMRAQRQQTKWVVLGIVLAFGGGGLVRSIVPMLAEPSSLLSWAVTASIGLFLILFPLSIGVAILRHRLYDIDILINRMLVYGTLTAVVVGAYMLVVVGLGTLLMHRQPGEGTLLLSLLATGLVAVLFQPLRERLQRAVNHLMFGERDDPYAVLARLDQRLEAAIAPDAVLPAIVETVATALKLPYVAVALDHDRTSTIVAAYGTAMDPALRLPLVYQHDTVGTLLVAARASGEVFNSADRRLLDDVARHAGVVAHAVRLTTELQHARERLVTAREEERRRLRRDLHDGLGPQLASLTLTIGAARELLRFDPPAADALLEELGQHASAAIVDIRRVIYALRPPALDDLGLLAALREQAAQHARHGLQVSVEAPAAIPPLSAAVDVAAYRIAQEALQNVVRHAQARSCVIRLAVDDAQLSIEIQDDGRGLPPDYRAGVGLHAMRERAVELGGTCVIDRTPRGTRVHAQVPLQQGE